MSAGELRFLCWCLLLSLPVNLHFPNFASRFLVQNLPLLLPVHSRNGKLYPLGDVCGVVHITTRLNGGGLDPTSDLKCMLCDYDDFAITNYSMFRYQTIINFVCNFQLKIEFYCFSNYFNVFNRR